MLNLYNAQLQHLAIHKVGNKSRGESLKTSSGYTEMDDESHAILKEFFLKAFRNSQENYYSFNPENDLELHPLFQCAKSVFENPEKCLDISKQIAAHLYNQSQHPHIRSGELYVVYLNEVFVNHKKTSALGIFKSELKHDFLQFDEAKPSIELLIQQGINLEKLDKGALIFNDNAEEGYRILSVDSNRYDAKYWLEQFLDVIPLADENFFTKRYLKFCKDFAKQVVLPAEDKKEEVLFLNRSMDYFAKNDDFEETAFLNETLDNPELIPEFKHFKTQKGPKYSIEDVTQFPIANSVVSDERRKTKSVISLDTHVQIKMDFINPDTANKYLEKGWDEERQMYYYLVYFNKEQKI